TYHTKARPVDTHTAPSSITITAVNDAPVAVNDAVTTAEDTAVSGNVLANDTDVDAGTTLTASLAASPAHGTVTLAANGAFTYTPAANYNGTDSFTYKANDGTVDSNTATVTITVTAVNDAPVAVNDAVTTAEDTPATIAVLANDSDADGDALTVSIGSQPSHGTATVNADQTIAYAPAADYNGSDSFTYAVNDGH